MWGRNSFYIDNLVVSVNTKTEAERVFNRLTALLKTAGMNVRDLTSNSQEFYRTVPADLAEDLQSVQLLSLQWKWDRGHTLLETESESAVGTKRKALGRGADLPSFRSPSTLCAFGRKIGLE